MKVPCTAPDCGSSDAKHIYPDGTAHCFSCGTHWHSLEEGEVAPKERPKASMHPGGEYHGFRGISHETCVKFKYKRILEKGMHIAPYFNKEGDYVAQHLRFDSDKKNMPWKGEPKNSTGLFGQQLWSAGASKRIVICEGEIDTLSVSEVLGNTWATVGVPGIDRTERILKENLEFLQRFDEIVLMYDNDEAGRKGIKASLGILPHNKTKFVKEFPPNCKDANDILVKYGQKALRDTVFYKAEKYVPAEVRPVSKIDMKQEDFTISLFPWESWNRRLFARRSGELSVYTSGSGMGKSTILRNIYFSLLEQGEACGLIMLEESVQETKADLMSHIINKPIRRILAQRGVNKAMVAKGLPELFTGIPDMSDEELAVAESKLNEMNLQLVDHVGGYNAQSLLDKIRYMAVSMGVKNILLDHITLMISSDETIENEVKSTDVIMKQLRSLAEECDINIDIISHIRKRGNGQKSTYGGAQISMEELRGSGSLYQVANNVICLERDQHDEDDKNKTTVRSLKSRLSGYTGIVGVLEYNAETGELTDGETIDTSFDSNNTDY